VSLREYHRKRDFARTAEPKGTTVQVRPAGIFVVQKHWASHLHYDFRLELDGVLKSWAVPKGPSLDPAQKRLAVQVEDHPFDYRNFEGTIPEGEYGGGVVMVWDFGHWMPQGEAEHDYRDGRLKFVLDGEKLKGGWMLVRLPDRDGRRSSKPNWLLIKEGDRFAQPESKGDILEKEPSSAKTGRTMEQIKEGKAVWKTRPKANTKHSAIKEPATAAASATKSKRPKSVSSIQQAGKRAALPKHWDPQLATLVTVAPEGDQWLHEIKFDGYRMACRLDDGDVTFLSRTNNDWTPRVADVAEQARLIPAKTALVDGEVVVLDEHGVSNFQLLQNALGGDRSAGKMLYCAFDLLYLDGHDLKKLPQIERKEALEALLKKLPQRARQIRYSEHVVGSGGTFHREACRTGLEGIISKRADAPYVGARSHYWLKVKCRQAQEMVIGGFTKPGGGRTGFGALLLGYYDAKGRFVYAGRVGTGFTDKTLRDLHRQLKALEQKKTPFDALPRGAGGADVTWIKPKLVAQVEFSNWTHENLLRQAAFLGLREDKSPAEVAREKPAETKAAARKPRRTAKRKSK
jgi:bifunctional non-homologous end joining protein LigD